MGLNHAIQSTMYLIRRRALPAIFSYSQVLGKKNWYSHFFGLHYRCLGLDETDWRAKWFSVMFFWSRELNLKAYKCLTTCEIISYEGLERLCAFLFCWDVSSCLESVGCYDITLIFKNAKNCKYVPIIHWEKMTWHRLWFWNFLKLNIISYVDIREYFDVVREWEMYP